MYVRLVPMGMMGSRTHARTRAIFSGRGVFGLFVFLGKRGGHMYVCVAEGEEEEEEGC